MPVLFRVLFDFLRLLLAAVFVIAGLAKLRNRARTREDLGELGLPPWAGSVASTGLPIVEIAVAALLLIEPLAAWGAGCALGLLATFTSIIGVNLWRGRRPACACFGALSRARMGAGTLVRNIMLMALAGVLLLPPPAIPAAYETPPAATLAIAGAAVLAGGMLLSLLFLAWWSFQLWRQQGRLLLRIEQLEQHAGAPSSAPVTLPRPPEIAGQPAPALTLRDSAGQRIDLQALRGTPTVLLFLDSACRHCQPLLSRLRTWHAAAHADTRVIVLLAGPRPQTQSFAPGIVVADGDDPGAMEAFGIVGTPSAVAIGADGIVAEPAARGYAAVAKLLDRLTSQEEPYELATV